MRARRLRSVILKLKVHQGDLAAAAKINRTVLNQFIHGRAQVTDEQLSAIEAGVKRIASEQLEKVLSVLAPAAA
jgi:DNA-binding transcriptional regulator YdaS (Cro superfamily)